MVENQNNTCNFVVGASASFDFGIRFFEPTDIHCYLQGVETELRQGVDFIVHGAESYVNGATITLQMNPLPTGKTLAIIRELPYRQQLSLPNSGKLPTESIERQLDRMLMIDQQLAEKLSRCIMVSPTDNTTPQQYLNTIFAAKDLCLDSASICTTSAQTCAAAQRTIGLVWAEISGDPSLANAALLTLKEAAEATGAVNAAVEAGKAGINEASSAALDYARNQVEETKTAAQNALNATSQSEMDRLNALISEAIGADGAVTAAKEAAEAAAQKAEGAVAGIDSKTASSLASLEAAKSVAQGYLDTAQAAANNALANADKADKDTLAALVKINDSISIAAGHKNSAGSSASAALKSAQDAALAEANAAASAASAGSISQTIADRSITAHNANGQAHKDIRDLFVTVSNRVSTLAGNLSTHNTDTEAHKDIRTKVSSVESAVADCAQKDLSNVDKSLLGPRIWKSMSGFSLSQTTPVTMQHNLHCDPMTARAEVLLVCTQASYGYAAGDVLCKPIQRVRGGDGAQEAAVPQTILTADSLTYIPSNATGGKFYLFRKDTGAWAALGEAEEAKWAIHFNIWY